jgi:hypothetical protein
MTDLIINFKEIRKSKSALAKEIYKWNKALRANNLTAEELYDNFVANYEHILFLYCISLGLVISESVYTKLSYHAYVFLKALHAFPTVTEFQYHAKYKVLKLLNATSTPLHRALIADAPFIQTQKTIVELAQEYVMLSALRMLEEEKLTEDFREICFSLIPQSDKSTQLEVDGYELGRRVQTASSNALIASLQLMQDDILQPFNSSYPNAREQDGALLANFLQIHIDSLVKLLAQNKGKNFVFTTIWKFLNTTETSLRQADSQRNFLVRNSLVATVLYQISAYLVPKNAPQLFWTLFQVDIKPTINASLKMLEISSEWLDLIDNCLATAYVNISDYRENFLTQVLCAPHVVGKAIWGLDYYGRSLNAGYEKSRKKVFNLLFELIESSTKKTVYKNLEKILNSLLVSTRYINVSWRSSSQDRAIQIIIDVLCTLPISSQRHANFKKNMLKFILRKDSLLAQVFTKEEKQLLISEYRACQSPVEEPVAELANEVIMPVNSNQQVNENNASNSDRSEKNEIEELDNTEGLNVDTAETFIDNEISLVTIEPDPQVINSPEVSEEHPLHYLAQVNYLFMLDEGKACSFEAKLSDEQFLQYSINWPVVTQQDFEKKRKILVLLHTPGTAFNNILNNVENDTLKSKLESELQLLQILNNLAVGVKPNTIMAHENDSEEIELQPHMIETAASNSITVQDYVLCFKTIWQSMISNITHMPQGYIQQLMQKIFTNVFKLQLTVDDKAQLYLLQSYLLETNAIKYLMEVIVKFFDGNILSVSDLNKAKYLTIRQHVTNCILNLPFATKEQQAYALKISLNAINPYCNLGQLLLTITSEETISSYANWLNNMLSYIFVQINSCQSITSDVIYLLMESLSKQGVAENSRLKILATIVSGLPEKDEEQTITKQQLIISMFDVRCDLGDWLVPIRAAEHYTKGHEDSELPTLYASRVKKLLKLLLPKLGKDDVVTYQKIVFNIFRSFHLIGKQYQIPLNAVSLLLGIVKSMPEKSLIEVAVKRIVLEYMLKCDGELYQYQSKKASIKSIYNQQLADVRRCLQQLPDKEDVSFYLGNCLNGSLSELINSLNTAENRYNFACRLALNITHYQKFFDILFPETITPATAISEAALAEICFYLASLGNSFSQYVLSSSKPEALLYRMILANTPYEVLQQSIAKIVVEQPSIIYDLHDYHASAVQPWYGISAKIKHAKVLKNLFTTLYSYIYAIPSSQNSPKLVKLMADIEQFSIDAGKWKEYFIEINNAVKELPQMLSNLTNKYIVNFSTGNHNTADKAIEVIASYLKMHSDSYETRALFIIWAQEYGNSSSGIIAKLFIELEQRDISLTYLTEGFPKNAITALSLYNSQLVSVDQAAVTICQAIQENWQTQQLQFIRWVNALSLSKNTPERMQVLFEMLAAKSCGLNNILAGYPGADIIAHQWLQNEFITPAIYYSALASYRISKAPQFQGDNLAYTIWGKPEELSGEPSNQNVAAGNTVTQFLSRLL